MNLKNLTIGRVNNNNVVVNYGKISSKHCAIRQVSDTEYVIEDLDSSNGTFVNGRRVKQCLIEKTDELILADFPVNTLLIFSLFDEEKMPISLTYDELLKKQDEIIKQQIIFGEFQKLKDVYDNYQKEKRKILRGDSVKKTGIRAGLSLIPVVGIALSQLSGTVGKSVQEKLMELTEQFKIDYICPKCFKFLGDEPWENMNKRGTCLYCKAKWK